jgi:hypothetical protein
MFLLVQSHPFLWQSGILLEWLPCVGCIKKKLSDSGAICVPASVPNIPPLSKKSVIKANSCAAEFGTQAHWLTTTVACQRAQVEYDRGTGCLAECQTQWLRYLTRSQHFCTFADICTVTAAPCNSKLVVQDVPPLTNTSLPPLPKGIDVDGALLLPSVLCSI